MFISNRVFILDIGRDILRNADVRLGLILNPQGADTKPGEIRGTFGLEVSFDWPWTDRRLPFWWRVWERPTIPLIPAR